MKKSQHPDRFGGGGQGCRISVSTADRHFYTIYAIFTRFYVILAQFYMIFTRFYATFAIFCQAQIFCRQAPKTSAPLPVGKAGHPFAEGERRHPWQQCQISQKLKLMGSCSYNFNDNQHLHIFTLSLAYICTISVQ